MTNRTTQDFQRLRAALAAAAVAAVLAAVGPAPALAQHAHHTPEEAPDDAQADEAGQQEHRHWMLGLPGGWHLAGMAQLFPIATAGFAPEESPLDHRSFYLTQPAAMLNFESADSRIALRLTPNFEGLTIADGEKTFGGWGEGFIDSRHPHTYLHELMLSWNVWEAPGGHFSLSAGRGFAAYGTDDPMARPAVNYPTNHHLSQILERWTVNAAYVYHGGWGVEASVFDGDEPESPGDVSNIGNFPNSWSTRVSRRLGAGHLAGPHAPWEVSASFGEVRETHGGDHTDLTRLANVALRHQAEAPAGRLYALAEASMSWPEHGDGYFSVLGEGQLERGPHRPYLRVEYAIRPEYEREGVDPPGFFRYDHDSQAIGATRWLIATAGYGHRVSGFPAAAKPFVEVGFHRVQHERGPVALEPDALFGTSSFWSLTAGLRVFLGASGPMRMGTYGVLDPMTHMHRDAPHDMHRMQDEHDAHPPHHPGTHEHHHGGAR